MKSTAAALTYFKTNFYDEKFSQNKKMYIFQCAAATLVVYFVLTTLSVISNYLVIASIASTSFIIFAGPHSERARARYVFGGYIIGTLSGVLSYYSLLYFSDLLPMFAPHLTEVFAALAVGCSLFFMVIFDLEHPPASSVALALVINYWGVRTLCVTFFALCVLVCSRHLLRKRLIQLI